MAEINASIPLQSTYPQPNVKDWANLAAIGQQISASKTAQRAQEAGIPGITAESALKTKTAAYQKWLSDNVGAYANEDGTPDTVRLLDAAGRAGFTTHATETRQADLTAKGTAIQNATNQQDQGIKKLDYIHSLLGHTATELSEIKDKGKAVSTLYQRAAMADSVMPGAGQQLLKSFLSTDKDGGYSGVDPDRLKAVRTATMTPLEQGNLALTTEQVTQAGIANMTGPEGRDPKSQGSKHARELAARLGFPVSEDTSAAEIVNIPGFKESYISNVVPAGVKAQGLQDAATHLQQSSSLISAAGAIDKLIASGKITSSTNLGEWLKANASKLGNDPDFRAAQAAVQAAVGVDPTFNLNLGANQMSAAMKQLSAQSLSKSRVSKQTATNTTFSQAAPAAEAAAANPAQPAAPIAVQPKLKVGDIRKGHVYLGGDPNVSSSWKPQGAK